MLNRQCMSLLAATAVVGCATPLPTTHLPPSPTRTTAFGASSLRSSYGIQVELSGTVSQRDDWLFVTIPTGSVRTYQGTAPAWDLMLRVGLATCVGPHHSEVVSESRAVRVSPHIGFTRDSSLLDTTAHRFRDTLRADLGVPRGVDPRRSWITVSLEWPIEGDLAQYSIDADGFLVPDSTGLTPLSHRVICR